MTFLRDSDIALASNHWLLSLSLDVQPYAQVIIKLEADLVLFKTSVEQKLAQYMPRTNKTVDHTPFEATDASLVHMIKHEIAKFGDDVAALKIMYHSVEVAFLQPEMDDPDYVMRGRIANWADATSKLHEPSLNQTSSLKAKRQVMKTMARATRQEYRDQRRRLRSGTRQVDATADLNGGPAPREPSVGQPARSKRSAILGFLSPILSTLFGLPSEGSWKMAQRNLRRLHDTNEALREALGQTLQIVNVTQQNIVTNKQAITQLRDNLKGARTGLNVILRGITDGTEG